MANIVTFPYNVSRNIHYVYVDKVKVGIDSVSDLDAFGFKKEIVATVWINNKFASKIIVRKLVDGEFSSWVHYGLFNDSRVNKAMTVCAQMI